MGGMSIPGQIEENLQATKEGFLGGSANALGAIEARLDRLSEQIELCIAEVVNLRIPGQILPSLPQRRTYRAPSKPKADGYLPVIPSDAPLRSEGSGTGPERAFSPDPLPGDSGILNSESQNNTIVRMATSGSLGDPQSYRSFRDMRDVSASEPGEAFEDVGDAAIETRRRRVQQARSLGQGQSAFLLRVTNGVSSQGLEDSRD